MGCSASINLGREHWQSNQRCIREEAVKESHSPSPQDDERNHDYLIRRAALGDNPTQEQIDAVVAYGLEQQTNISQESLALYL